MQMLKRDHVIVHLMFDKLYGIINVNFDFTRDNYNRTKLEKYLLILLVNFMGDMKNAR